MACGCNADKKTKVSFVHTDRDGKVTSFAAEALAKAAVARRGGSYVKK